MAEIRHALEVRHSLARILAASACDLGDERSILSTLQDAGIPQGTISCLMEEAVELARVIRQQDTGLVFEIDTTTALANGDCR